MIYEEISNHTKRSTIMKVYKLNGKIYFPPHGNEKGPLHLIILINISDALQFYTLDGETPKMIKEGDVLSKNGSALKYKVAYVSTTKAIVVMVCTTPSNLSNRSKATESDYPDLPSDFKL